MTIIRPQGMMLINALDELRKNCQDTWITPGGTYINDSGIRFLLTKNIDTEIDGSRNGLNLYGIGIFSIKIEQLKDYNIFCFSNFNRKQNEYIILPKQELLNRIENNYSKVEDEMHLRFWLIETRATRNNLKLLETKEIGTEYEFMGLWLDQNRDYTRFHNNWSLIR